MGRINNKKKYPIKNNPTSQDRVVLIDSENNDKTMSTTLDVVIALALAGGTDTFATLNGNVITFPDSQTIDVTPVVDTNTNTFATLSGTIITFEDGSVIDTTINNATLNGNIITFGDGQTADITPVVDTDTNTFAVLSGGTITFADGQSITIPTNNTDDQTAAEVPVSPITGLLANQVQAALEELLSNIPNQTSDLTNDGSNGSDPFITASSLSNYTLDINANILRLLSAGDPVSTVDLSLYLDDTNLSRLVNGTLDPNTGIATFTRDDNSTFTVDFSALLVTYGLDDILSVQQPLSTNRSVDLNGSGLVFEDSTLPFNNFFVTGNSMGINGKGNVTANIGVLSLNTSQFNGTGGNGNILMNAGGDTLLVNNTNSLGLTILNTVNHGILLNTSDTTHGGRVAILNATDNKAFRYDTTMDLILQNDNDIPNKKYVDDLFEEGTFTPVLIDGTGSATYSLGSFSYGKYRKVGKTVFYNILLDQITTSGAPTSQLQITGFPFGTVSDSLQTAAIGSMSGTNVAFSSVFAQIDKTSLIAFRYKAATFSAVANYNNVTITNGQIVLSGTYLLD